MLFQFCTMQSGLEHLAFAALPPLRIGIPKVQPSSVVCRRPFLLPPLVLPAILLRSFGSQECTMSIVSLVTHKRATSQWVVSCFLCLESLYSSARGSGK